MVPYWSLLVCMGLRPYGLLWVYMGPCGFLRVLIGPYGSLWVLMGPCGSLWVFMVPYGCLWLFKFEVRSTVKTPKFGLEFEISMF